MNGWARDAIFYHIYPLGACGAPKRNDFRSAPEPRLSVIEGWVPHIAGLGCTAVWLGPVFESTAHGYDTADYRKVDRRLGTGADLRRLVDRFHEAGIRVVFDGVFNHSGRDFPPFRDLLEKGEVSPYRGWFKGVDFSRHSPAGDPFFYEGWNGCYDLAKLDLKNGEVRNYLLDSVRSWFSDFGIDGIRLDAADCVDLAFQRDLATLVRGIDPDAFLVGEIVHGDYRHWVNGETLDSVTNYECYKGLWSSHNDRNYFEIAWSLDRQFGPSGLYRDLPLYNFAENHDVDRVASLLADPAHLYPLYLILFSMPGIPSVYYGGEWGWLGRKLPGDDSPVRPALDGMATGEQAPQPDLERAITRFAHVRTRSEALRRGDYRGLLVESRRFAFSRSYGGETVVVAVSTLKSPSSARIRVNVPDGTVFKDLLNPGYSVVASGGTITCVLDPSWGRILTNRPA